MEVSNFLNHELIKNDRQCIDVGFRVIYKLNFFVI